MRIPHVLASLALVATSLLNPGLRAPVVAAQESPKSGKAALAVPVDALLKAKFPQWRPKQLSDMGADDQQLWLNGPNGNESPGIAMGHFQFPHELSYAVLLVRKSDPSAGYKLLVFSKGPSKEAFSWKLLDHAEGQTCSCLVISKTEPGKYSDWENKRSVQLKLDGIQMEWMEKGAQLYYWSESRYRTLQVSD
jgi:hypothetical protein